MKVERYKLHIALIALLLIVAASITGFMGKGESGKRVIVSRLENNVISKEKLTSKFVDFLADDIISGSFFINYFENKGYEKAANNDITLLVYSDNMLKYWSDNTFEVPPVYNQELFGEPIIFLQNGWFIPEISDRSGYMIVGLFRVSTIYGIENDIVSSGFSTKLKPSEEVLFNKSRLTDGHPIFNEAGEYLFSVLFREKSRHNILITLSLVLWVMSFVSILLLISTISAYCSNKGRGVLGVTVATSILIATYFLSLLTGKPSVLYDTELFSPLVFTLNGIIPSIGHLLIASVIIFTLSVLLGRHIPVKQKTHDRSLSEEISIVILFFAGSLLVSFAHTLFSRILSESNINLEFYKILDLNYLSIAAFIPVLLIFFSSFLFFFRAMSSVTESIFKTIILPLIASFSVIVLLYHKDLFAIIAVTALFLLQITFSILASRKKMGFFNLSVFYSLLISIYALIIITIYSENKRDEKIKIQALDFSIENDPEAELLLIDLWPEIKSDTILQNMMMVDRFGNDDYLMINDYLNNKYFSNNWSNYIISIYLCEERQSIRIDGENDVSADCFTFFENRVSEHGQAITGTDFYFLDDQAGRTCYLGKLYFDDGRRGINGLFIELFSDVNIFQPGYSELLLDKKYHGYSGLSDYSFIKYINGSTAISYGEYDYNSKDSVYLSNIRSDYLIFKEGGYKHILFKNGDSTVIISRPSISGPNLLISFAYIFVFTLIWVNISIYLIKVNGFKPMRAPNLRQKFQIAIIAILLISSIFVGFLVANLTISRYESNHYENIKEKIVSVSLALNYDFAGVDFLRVLETGNMNLNEILIDLSNVFNTDINLYNTGGGLVATSRPELFNKDLISARMDNTALINLSVFGKTGFTHTEMVGKMKYISSYAPYSDGSGRVMGYLNLPYFRMQSSFAKEISDMIVAVINFTLLLIIITMGIAVFIVGKITFPLSMLSRGLASVELGKKAEHINYNDQDEIGDLIKQYNLMVDELDESATKLANSEREYAWREMAKQIAHEIKNPLTPMKLNVQQLHKSFKDKVEDFDTRMDNFAKNQIEYIDNLSTIASAFSSFAKMPGSNPSQIDIVEQIKTTLELFRNTQNITFEESWPAEEKVFVYADREQLNGVFSNLIKNGIQAIPQGKSGIIIISLKVLRDKCLVSITDNGSGIPDTIREKLFTPYFTTKSSGTGLGLSIVKKHIESCGGKIWFESDSQKGTSFFVEMPLMFTVEKPGKV